MKHFLPLCLLLCAMTLCTMAKDNDDSKEQKLTVFGEVYDSFTKGKVKAFVTVMTEDSTVVDTTTCFTHETRTYSYYDVKVPKKAGKYIFKATAEGYEDTYMNYTLDYNKRKKWYDIPDILMKKKQEDIYKDVDLDGVVVKGTRIQVAYKGDTIVYDASAFKLPEGSMLDGLIKQLPGAELKDNGDIYINGKKIDYLTLNGKDFFKGDNKVMLENLPYFTVKNIKVFNKDTQMSELMGKRMEKKDYVMDVTLKREYARGYIANAEAGAGTEGRWRGRMFGLYYDDHTRVSAFFNANNLNETRKPGSDGNWRSSYESGLTTTRHAGTNINTESKDKKKTFNTDIELKWRDIDNEDRTFRETYSDHGSIFSNSAYRFKNKAFNFNSNHMFNMTNKEQTNFLMMQAYIRYTNNENNSERKDSTYTTSLTNRNSIFGYGKNRTFSTDAVFFVGHRFKHDDLLYLDLSGKYSNTSPSDNFSREETFYANTATTERRARYTDSRNDSYRFSPTLTFEYQLPASLSLNASAKYAQDYASRHNDKYNLERLEEALDNAIDWLPSQREDMARAFDRDNSYSYEDMTREYKGTISLRRSTDNSWLDISLPYSHFTERMNYTGNKLDTIAHRTYNSFSPRISYYTFGKANPELSLSYNMNTSEQAFTSLMPKTDTSNPLYTNINNPNLGHTTRHYFNNRITFKNDSLSSSVYINLDAQITCNAVGSRTAYNSVTGAYTSMMDNIDGNWNTTLSAGWNRPLDKEKRLRMSVNGGVTYNRSVDFATYTYTESGSDDIMKSPLSKVNNVDLRADTKFSYSKGDLTAAVQGSITSRHTRGELDIVSSIDACDYTYGANVTYTIPLLKITIASDITMWSRRGYTSEMMNNDELIWNAELSRSFCKGALTAKAQAFDLLKQISSKRYNVNAQGRTEGWYNNVPSYVMFSLAYKFTQKPKK